MRQSHLFTKTRKENPSDEVAKNAQLLIRSGFIHKEMAGAYDLLPLGLRTIEKIKSIIREEMNALGGQEMIMTSLQNKDTWMPTDRWSDDRVDVWFKSPLHAGGEIGFGWSHEEPITNMMKNHLASFRDVPAYVYQFQVKMRNELRAKSGLLRGREFIMKDMYSYTLNQASHDEIYQATMDAYMRIFDRIGIGERTFITRAEGGAFTDNYSHEFQTICDAGEDEIFVHKKTKEAFNKEVMTDDFLKELGYEQTDFNTHITAEVGNIFSFGTTKSEEMGLSIIHEDGSSKPVHLGSYGIGITRLMAVIAEVYSDDKGLVWPQSIAPFDAHLISLGQDDDAEKIYTQLQERNIEVLYDDRDARAGEKFSNADLIGIPYRIIISKGSLEKGGVEVKKRNEDASQIYSVDDLITLLNQ